MVKPKQKQLLAIPVNKSAKHHQSGGNEVDLPREDGWVIVKKQRVTILIPPLPAAKQSTTLNPGSSQLQALPRKTISDGLKLPVKTYPQVHLVDEQEKSMSLTPPKKSQIDRKVASALPVSKLIELPRLNFMTGSEMPDQVGTSSKSRKASWGLGPSKAVKQPKHLNGSFGFVDRCALLSQKLRASNLERKIRRAGGLSSWLTSLGLEQFVKIFRGKSVNKFQLVNLTMKKLKDMGADAVGPRRKLMHAIDCLCQPYCFEAV